MGRTRAATAVLGVLLLSGCVLRATSTPDETRQERVDREFSRMAADIGEKERITGVSAAHVLVASDTLPDGTRLTLWTNDPAVTANFVSRCFYLDSEPAAGVERGNGGATGMGGCGGGPQDDYVTLNGDLSVVGSVGTWPATRVRVTAGGADAELGVVGGYFLVPHTLRGSTYAVTLLGAGGAVLGTVRDLRAPGAAVPSPSPT